MFPIQNTNIRPKKVKRPNERKTFNLKPKEHDPYSDWKSAWFVTLNTNQTNIGIIEPLQEVWTHVVKYIQDFIYGRGYYTGHKETNRVIERGTKYGRIHMHTKLEISTKGIAYLDFVKINQFINRQLRQIPTFRGVYFNAKLIKNYNNDMLIAKYTTKAPYLPRLNMYPGFRII